MLARANSAEFGHLPPSQIVPRLASRARTVARNQDTFGKDIEMMAARKLTFAEVIEGAEFPIMAKQRIKTVQRDLFEQLDAVGF